jgi:hypothetical protein
VIALEAEVFVEVEGDDVFEAEPFFAMEPDEFAIKRNRCGAGGESQDSALTGLLSCGDERPDLLRQGAGAGMADGREPGISVLRSRIPA